MYSVERRVDGVFEPTTVTTIDIINTPSGPVTQTCSITLTPITVKGGGQKVKQVKNCKLSKNAAVVSSTIVTTTTTASPTTAVPDAPLAVSSASTVNPPAEPTEDSSEPVSTPTTTLEAAPATTSAQAASAVSPSNSLPAAAAQQSPGSSFSMPGKKLSVLPIGLGVFAGISVIALIVVGLVTYERTKYRKLFRQRKLAEAGADMGYGGMVQRT